MIQPYISPELAMSANSNKVLLAKLDAMQLLLIDYI